MNYPTAWTEQEVAFLRDNYRVLSRKAIGREIGRTVNAVNRRIQILGLETRIPATVNHGFFSSVTNTSANLAGFIAADGCLLEKRFEMALDLQVRDTTHLLKFAFLTEYTGKIYVINRKDKGWHCYLKVTNIPEWHQDLGHIYNITPRKSLTLQPPNLTEKEHIYSYIAGLLDGDGSITFLEGHPFPWRIHIYGNEDILDFIKFNFDKDFPSSRQSKIVNNGPKNKIKQYSVSGERCMRILDYMHSLGIPHLERKWLPYLKFKEERDNERQISV